MFKLILHILQNYGVTWALLLGILGLLWYVVKILFKMKNNHLAHIEKAIIANGEKIESLDDKTGVLAERVSHLEGKLDVE